MSSITDDATEAPMELSVSVSAVVNPAAYAKDCHNGALAVVRAGLATRVARGWCEAVLGQHSWAVVGEDCYDEDATIIDVSLWSYTGAPPQVWVGTMECHPRHMPHGRGSIWETGRPAPPGPDDMVVELTPSVMLSQDARAFLSALGPLHAEGWARLVNHCGMEGWPAAEIVAAMLDTDRLACLVPIDIAGMVTDRNPGGLYR
jgi:hypothetical protein